MAVTVSKLVIFCLLFGLVVSQIPRRERPKNRTKATQRTTRPPVSEEESDSDGATDQCPEPFGFFADADQCDKYYGCYEGEISEKLCDDGFVFNDYDIKVEKCDLPNNIDCSKRPALQTPQPIGNCPRKNGYFAHENPNVCDKFYYCVGGNANMYTCPQGLVFSPKTGICTWADQAGRSGCSSEEIFSFSCKKVNESEALSHPRYPDPDDCQYFYVCINGDTPRRNGCKYGQVFNEKSKNCDWPRHVPECSDFYNGKLTDEQLDELENPKTTTPRIRKNPSDKTPVASRRRPARPQTTRRVVTEEDEDIE